MTKNLVKLDAKNKAYMVNGVDVHHVRSVNVNIDDGGRCTVDMSFEADVYTDIPHLNIEHRTIELKDGTKKTITIGHGEEAS